MPESKIALQREEGRSFADQPSGYMLHKATLWVFGGILFLAAWKGQAGIVILLGLVFSAAGLAALWSRVSLAGVRCRRRIHERRFFPGESTELTLEIFNRKPLPLPWVKIDDEIPVELARDLAPVPANRPGYYLLSRWASILWYRKVSWKCQLHGEKRGYYRLGSLTVTSGDIFGFYPRWRQFASADHITVYPRIFPIERLCFAGPYCHEQRICLAVLFCCCAEPVLRESWHRAGHASVVALLYVRGEFRVFREHFAPAQLGHGGKP